MCHIPQEFPAGNAPLAAPLPLSCSEVAAGAAAQVPPVRVGAAVAAGAAPGRALVHVLAAPEGLVEVEARGTNALEAAQGVVAGGRATGRGAGALVLICMESRNRGITESRNHGIVGCPPQVQGNSHRYRMHPTGYRTPPPGGSPTHPRTGSTGSAARSPGGSRSGTPRAHSGSRAGTGGSRHTRPHLHPRDTQGPELRDPPGCSWGWVAPVPNSGSAAQN